MDPTAEDENKAQQLQNYKEQLSVLDQALNDPATSSEDKEALADTRNDLVEVIKLLEEVVGLEDEQPADEKTQQSGQQQQGQQGQQTQISQQQQFNQQASSSSSSALNLAPSVAGQIPPNHPGQQQQQQLQRQAQRKHELIGRTCEVAVNGSWFNAEIFHIRRDENGIDRATLTIFGKTAGGSTNTLNSSSSGASGARKEVRLTDIKLLKPPAPASCLPGTKVQAIHVNDGLWYDAVVEEHTSRGYYVRFLDSSSSSSSSSTANDINGSNNSYKEEVKFDQIRIKSSSLLNSTSSTTVGGIQVPSLKRGAIVGKEVVTPGGYVLPETFLVRPDDTDDIKKAKQRKIHHVKTIQREERAELDALKSASSWQKFKVVGKRAGGFAGVKKSIFNANTGGSAGNVPGFKK